MQSSPESAPQDDKFVALEAVARPLPPMTIAQNVALMRQFSRTKAGKTSISLSVMMAVVTSSMWQFSPQSPLAMVLLGCSISTLFFLAPFANYRRFSSMELPARSPEALQGLRADQDEALPVGMRPIARELHGVLSSLEATFDELYGRLLRNELLDIDLVIGAIDTHDFAIWLSRWDTLDEEALAVAQRRGFSIEKIRGLLAGQRSPEVMARDGVTLAAGLSIVRFSSEHPDSKALEAIRSRVGSGDRVSRYRVWREVKVKQKLLKAQIEHLRAVILELRRIEDALHQPAQHPYR